jgi:hypothetical protein
MAHDLTRADVRVVVATGLEQTGGNYTTLLDLFNMMPGDYKRFLGFLHKHECHLPILQFRGRLSRALPAEPIGHDSSGMSRTASRAILAPARPVRDRKPARAPGAEAVTSARA